MLRQAGRVAARGGLDDPAVLLDHPSPVAAGAERGEDEPADAVELREDARVHGAAVMGAEDTVLRVRRPSAVVRVEALEVRTQRREREIGDALVVGVERGCRDARAPAHRGGRERLASRILLELGGELHDGVDEAAAGLDGARIVALGVPGAGRLAGGLPLGLALGVAGGLEGRRIGMRRRTRLERRVDAFGIGGARGHIVGGHASRPRARGREAGWHPLRERRTPRRTTGPRARRPRAPPAPNAAVPAGSTRALRRGPGLDAATPDGLHGRPCGRLPYCTS